MESITQDFWLKLQYFNSAVLTVGKGEERKVSLDITNVIILSFTQAIHTGL